LVSSVARLINEASDHIDHTDVHQHDSAGPVGGSLVSASLAGSGDGRRRDVMVTSRRRSDMGCGKVVGRFRFRIAVTSTVDIWEPISQPAVIVGGHAIDYALTISRVSGNVSAIPATALMNRRAAPGPRSRARRTTSPI
jgi:hypothetical protein